jgi:hypothetical protein
MVSARLLSNPSQPPMSGKYDITGNVVSLVAVQTGWILPELEKEEASHVPLRRVGQPEDGANVIVFFAMVTAICDNVSGGFYFSRRKRCQKFKRTE